MQLQAKNQPNGGYLRGVTQFCGYVVQTKSTNAKNRRLYRKGAVQKGQNFWEFLGKVP